MHAGHDSGAHVRGFTLLLAAAGVRAAAVIAVSMVVLSDLKLCDGG